MNSQNQTIAILDSGVGGLSIFNSIRSILPHYSFVYGCDNKHFPYGPKDSETVTRCITALTKKTIEQFSPEMIVIACNTASTVALETLRNQFSIPIVGVVPAIKPAAAQSKSKVIGLLATPGTVNRAYTEQLIRSYASNIEVIKVGSTRLVDLAEHKLRGKTIESAEIKKEIEPFFNHNLPAKLDTIVLGCTHFPLLIDELSNCVPYPIRWIDSSEAVAIRVKSLASENKQSAVSLTAIFTELNDQAKSLTTHLKQIGFSEIIEIK